MCLKQQDMGFLPAQLGVSPIKMVLGPNKNGSLAINRAGIHPENLGYVGEVRPVRGMGQAMTKPNIDDPSIT